MLWLPTICRSEACIMTPVQLFWSLSGLSGSLKLNNGNQDNRSQDRLCQLVRSTPGFAPRRNKQRLTSHVRSEAGFCRGLRRKAGRGKKIIQLLKGDNQAWQQGAKCVAASGVQATSGYDANDTRESHDISVKLNQGRKMT